MAKKKQAAKKPRREAADDADLQAIQQAFAPGAATIEERVKTLEDRVAALEQKQLPERRDRSRRW